MTNSLPPIAPLTVPASTANTYTDLNGLSALKQDSRSPQALHAIAQQVDALFLQMMLKSMRDATSGDGESDSNEMGMYRDMFDKQIALTLSQHQSLGLGSLVTAAEARAAAAGTASPSGRIPASQTPATPATPPPARPAPAAPAASAGANSTSATRPATSGATTGATSGATGGATPGAPSKAAAPSGALQEIASRFVSEVLPAITRAAQALGVSPLGMLAQAALETGWGTRMARTAAGASSLNLFGIKADEAWGGTRAGAMTLEFSGGAATQRYSSFRAYGSIDESVSDYADLLKRSPRYCGALAAGSDAQAYIDRIGRAGYATDPGYAGKLNDILNGGTLALALHVARTKL